MPSKIKKRGENSYLLTVAAGYDGQGKQIVYTRTVQATGPNEAKKMYNDFASEVQKGNITTTGKLKLKDFADRWYKEHCEKNLAPKTQRSYKLHLEKRIVPALGNLDINKIKPLQIISFINNLQEPGLRLDGKEGTLSDDAVKYCYCVLSSMLTDAVQWQIIPSNPCDRVKPPTVKKNKAANSSYDEEQTIKLITALEKEPLKHQITILLAIVTGLRLGELCGLEWKDLNLQAGVLSVNRASQSLSRIGTFVKDPKNESSNRAITLPQGIIPLLKEFKADQNEERLRLGDKWLNSDRLLVQWDGKPIYTTSPSQWFSKFLARYNKSIDEYEQLTDAQKAASKLPVIRFHDLRHTSGSLLIAKGVPLKNVSSRLGHADIRTTANIYGHALQSVDKEIANTMDDIIFKDKQAGLK
jgi:integrase